MTTPKKMLIIALVSASALMASQSHTPIKTFEASFKTTLQNAVLKSAIMHSATQEGWKVSQLDTGSLLLEKPYVTTRSVLRSISKVPRKVSTTKMIKTSIQYTPSDIAFATNLNQSDRLYSNVKMLKSSIHKELARLSAAVAKNEFEKTLLNKVKEQGWEIADVGSEAITIKKMHTHEVSKRVAYAKTPRKVIQQTEVVATVAFDDYHITSIKTDALKAVALQEIVAADLHALKDSVHMDSLYALR